MSEAVAVQPKPAEEVMRDSNLSILRSLGLEDEGQLRVISRMLDATYTAGKLAGLFEGFKVCEPK
jgi:hypothetical protein